MSGTLLRLRADLSLYYILLLADRFYREISPNVIHRTRVSFTDTTPFTSDGFLPFRSTPGDNSICGVIRRD